MNVLLDTNVLTRLAQPAHAHYQAAQTALASLVARGDTPTLVPQVLYEFWVVATRPVAANGLGMMTAQVEADVTRLEGLYLFLPDSAGIYPEWKRLVSTHQVSGKTAHDARLVAAMTVHGLTHILTFNIADFARFGVITALDPTSFSQPSPPP